MKMSIKILLGLLAAICIIGILPILKINNVFSGVNVSERIVGEGDIQTKEINISDFENLEISQFFDVILTQGPTHFAMEGEPNILKEIEVKNDNGTLVISKKRNIKLKPKKTPKLLVSTPNLKKIYMIGTGTLTSTNEIKGDNFEIQISGSADMNLQLKCETLNANLSGAGNLKLDGNANFLQISTSGAGNIEALKFETQNANIQISGAGNVEVNVKDHLEAQISGVGNISYVGNPASVNKNISGMGNVSPK